jgi:hypothetical protein
MEPKLPAAQTDKAFAELVRVADRLATLAVERWSARGLKAKSDSVRIFFIGACAAASAVYMILDLSSPYSGFFRASPAPLQQVLAVIGKE